MYQITDFNIGDVLYASWGYEQTNYDFYQVVRKTEKKLIVKKIKSQYGKSVGFMANTVTPIKNDFISDEIQISFRSWGLTSTKIYGAICQYNGGEMVETHYA